MSLKIKSVLSQKLHLTTIPEHRQANFKSPLRSNLSRLSSTPLKNLSQERNKKKLTKFKDSESQNTQNNNKEIMENLYSLEEQYQSLKNNLVRSNSMKESLKIKGVPLSSINLNHRQSFGVKKISSHMAESIYTLNSTVKTRNNSISNHQETMKVVSIGFQCQKKKKHTTKKKGIEISLLQNRHRTIKLY